MIIYWLETHLQSTKQSNYYIWKVSTKRCLLKVFDKLTDYLSCEIVLSEDRKKAWIGQPHLISNLEKKFGDKVKNLRTYKTPGTLNLSMIRNTNNNPIVSSDSEYQKLFRSGVGMLLYLVKNRSQILQIQLGNYLKCLTVPLQQPWKNYTELLSTCWILETKAWKLYLSLEIVVRGISYVLVTVIMQEIQILNKVYLVLFCMWRRNEVLL